MSQPSHALAALSTHSPRHDLRLSSGILSFYAVHTFMRQTASSGKITNHTGLQRAAQEELLRMCLIWGDLRLSVCVCSYCVFWPIDPPGLPHL